MKKNNLDIMDSNCKTLGKKWTILIILELYKEESKKKRYTEIKKRLPGITSKILSVRLKDLEKEGIIKKETNASKFPIKCEYSLTDIGKDFIPIIKATKEWALRKKNG